MKWLYRGIFRVRGLFLYGILVDGKEMEILMNPYPLLLFPWLILISYNKSITVSKRALLSSISPPQRMMKPEGSLGDPQICSRCQK